MLNEIPTVEILFLTYNRLYYTRHTLPALLASSNYPFKVHIVDNGSSDGTVEYLQSLSHNKIASITLHTKNKGLVAPTKKFWRRSTAELVGKIDNDILVPYGWIEKLVAAHKQINELGAIGFSHFRDEDYNSELVKQKSSIEKPNKYKAQRKLFQNKVLYGFTQYQQKLAERGLFHGYLCDAEKNLYCWEHLDDPRHKLWNDNPEYLYETRQIKAQNFIEQLSADAKKMLECQPT